MTTLEQGQQAKITRPTARFMMAHPAHLLALGFGSGLARIMPGTVGTLFGWLSFHAFSTRWPEVFTPQAWGLIIVIGFFVGIWACAKTGRDMGIADHGGMVWDEIIAIWLVLAVITPASFKAQCWAFVVFRFFDMVKPPPIRGFERRFKGGFGVMWDDIVAAFYTLLVLALWRLL
jgi:phosphatidylglycerophosphatase A